MKKHLIIITSLASAIYGCVYKIDIEQGNLISQAQVDQLRPGMTANQVRYIMGTPLLVDPFHPNRWDYVYSFQKGGGPRELLHLSLFFDSRERLTALQGDFRPKASKELVTPEITTVEVPPRKIERGIFQMIGDFFRRLFS